jgi:hypothetical protein
MHEDIQSETFWWGLAAGPQRFVADVTQSVLDGRNVFLAGCEEIAWCQTLFSIVEAQARDFDEALRFYCFDWSCNKPAQITPADFLLREFASADVAEGYSSSSGISKPEYILKNSVLKERVIWLCGLTDETVAPWREFCKAFRGRGSSDGVIVIECTGPARQSRNLKHIDYSDYISEYDTLVLADLLASSLNVSKAWKSYIAHLATHLLGARAEEYEDFICRHDFTRNEPEDLLSGDAPAKDLERLVWEAQVEQLYSIVERQRIQFIAAHEAEIAAALDADFWDEKRGETRLLTQELGNVGNVYEIELGYLYLMMHLRKSRDSQQFLLYLPEENARERLRLLRDVRNKLAHMQKCSVGEVSALLALVQ